MSRTLEQKRAKYALLDVIMPVKEIHDELKSKKGMNKEAENNFKDYDKFVKKYATFIRRTPTMILNNGLGQALAFLLSKQNKESAAKDFYEQLQKWLCGNKDDGNKHETYPARVYTTGEPDLIYQLMAGTRQEYMRAQTEALALFDWMKKFADAYLPEDKGGKE